MNFRTILTVQGILLAVFGLSGIFIPETFWGLYGVTLNETGILVAKLAGIIMTGNALFSWLSRDTKDKLALKNIGIKNIFDWGASFVLFIIGQLGGVFNTLNWSNVVLLAVMTVWWWMIHSRNK